MFIYQMRLKKIYISLTVIVLFLATAFSVVKAEKKDLDYGNQPIVDSDLDGLTDQGEIQIYGTDYKNADTDDDGIMDGIEVINNTSPLDINDPALSPIATKQETPWVWYIGRSTGVIGFAFFWITIFLGLAIRNPLLKKIIEPIYSFDFHCFMAVMTVFWALMHGASFLLHGVFSLGLADVSIPFFSKTTLVNINYLALGIIAFYGIVVMTITSFLRGYIRYKLWRILHFLNPVAFIFVVLHGYFIGTDMKNVYFGGIFLISLIVICLIYASNLIFLIIDKIKKNN